MYYSSHTLENSFQSKGAFFIQLKKKEICKQEWTGTAMFLGWSSVNMLLFSLKVVGNLLAGILFI